MDRPGAIRPEEELAAARAGAARAFSRGLTPLFWGALGMTGADRSVTHGEPMPAFHRIRRALGAVLAVPLFAGCATAPSPPAEADPGAFLRRRAEQSFAEAVLLKPRAAVPEEVSAVRLAPLLMLETGSSNPAPDAAAVPAVFFTEGAVLLNGRVHAQMSYAWRGAPRPPAPDHPLPWQGIRITLNTAGDPVIWEVLQDSSGAALLFVARSLEVAALGEHGPALPGRRHAVERAVHEAPGVVVVRVIEDGPVPMGPIVHLDSARGDVTSVICRCMAPQVRHLSGQGEYELLPSGTDPEIPAHEPEGERLGLILRLPSSF